MNHKDPVKILLRFLPESSVMHIWKWLQENRVHLRITRKRVTKTGDYRPPFFQKSKGHRITVNGELNQYDFLLTLLHEMAHLITWTRHKTGVDPHGDEWKSAYRELIQRYIDLGSFPDDVRGALKSHKQNPPACGNVDLTLLRAVKKYGNTNGAVFLEDLPDGALFRIRNGRRFRKGRKLRKRYVCRCLDNGKDYLIPQTAEVVRIEGEYHLQSPPESGNKRENYNKSSGLLHLEDLPDGSLFRAPNGKVFRKGRKLRKRFVCWCRDDGKEYLVSPIVEVAMEMKES